MLLHETPQMLRRCCHSLAGSVVAVPGSPAVYGTSSNLRDLSVAQLFIAIDIACQFGFLPECWTFGDAAGVPAVDALVETMIALAHEALESGDKYSPLCRLVFRTFLQLDEEMRKKGEVPDEWQVTWERAA